MAFCRATECFDTLSNGHGIANASSAVGRHTGHFQQAVNARCLRDLRQVTVYVEQRYETRIQIRADQRIPEVVERSVVGQPDLQ